MPTRSKTSATAKAFKKVKKVSVSKAKKDLDRIFSEYIRRRDGGVCFTCGKQDDWKRMQNGHFVTRSANSTRFDEVNCNCQCVGCNVFKYGNMVAYSINIVRKYGPGMIERLHKKGQQVKQWTVPELQEMIRTYKLKIQELE